MSVRCGTLSDMSDKSDKSDFIGVPQVQKKGAAAKFFSFAAALGVGKSNLSELDLFDPGVGDQVVSGERGMNPVGGPEF